MKYVMGYLVMGIIMMFMAAAIHLIVAEKQGYKAIEYWNENAASIYASVRRDIASIIIGFILWPVRIMQFSLMISDYYALYEYDPNKSEEEEG